KPTLLLYPYTTLFRSKQSFSKKTIGEDSIVGEIDAEGNFILLKDTVSLLENWNYNLLTYYEIDANLTSLSFFKDDIGEIYLRAKGEDYSSTTALTVINQSFLQGEGISCTSNTCSNSSTECVPKKDKRSEERRVGKEGRCRCRRHDLTKMYNVKIELHYPSTGQR